MNSKLTSPIKPLLLQFLLLSVVLSQAAVAQSGSCTPRWLPTFGGEPGMNRVVRALKVFDDGNGPALYAAGDFETASGVLADGIAKWDGTKWISLDGGPSGSVKSLAVFDDGNGDALYAGGNDIAKWDGTSWSPISSGVGGSVNALVVYDDGNGERLVAAGSFATVGGIQANCIASWNGSTWSALGTGVSNNGISALAVFDDGNGAALYAGGTFLAAGGVPATRIAKWDSSTWTPLGSGIDNAVRALAVFDDGNGERLYAGGIFTSAGGVAVSDIAKWNGSNWSGVGSGVAGSIKAFEVLDDGSGAKLYAGGRFQSAGGAPANYIATWDGTNWAPLGSEVSNHVEALAGFGDGVGAVLFAGGIFTSAGGVSATRIAQYAGASWTPLGSGMNNAVNALIAFDDGGGEELYAGGYFDTPGGGVAASRIAKWDGSSWAPLGGGTAQYIFALSAFDDGGGTALYAGGRFVTPGVGLPCQIAKWDNSSWAPLGTGLGCFGDVYTLTVFDDGSGDALYAGGSFESQFSAFDYVAKWDGSTWSSLGNGISGIVHALTVFDGGTGAALYAGGSLDFAAGVQVNRIGRWDGMNWTPLGSGLNGTVFALSVFNDGTGDQLIVGGTFDLVGGVGARNIAKWNGSTWAPLGNGIGGEQDAVISLQVFDTGSGDRLFAGGRFTTAGGVAANNIAAWDGSSWSALGSGVGGIYPAVWSMTSFNSGTGDQLIAGGTFTSAFDSADSFIARYGCPSVETSDLCNGNGGVQQGCTNCPCSNNAPPGTIGGCLNSSSVAARLGVSGDPAVNLLPGDTDDLRFTLTNAPMNAQCLLISGDALAPVNLAHPCFGRQSGAVAAPFDGLRCAVTNTRRHGGRSADVNGEVGVTNSPWGGEGEPRTGIAVAGGLFTAGQTRFFQVIYRDDPLMICQRGLNTSQAVSVTFTTGQ